MDWLTSFVVVRLTEEARFCEVYETNDLTKAKYWLSYIGEQGDALCRTPKHPKYTGEENRPEYWSHKEGTGTGKIVSDERRWRDRFLRGHGDTPLPAIKATPGRLVGH